MILPVAAGVAAAGTAAYGAFHRNSSVFGSVLHQLPETASPTVALTFDDGPNPYATPLVLDALGRAGVRVTFFFLGTHVERWPEIARRAAAEGHQIGNHGYFHRKLHFRTPGYVRDDLRRGKRAIEAACGVSPMFFRAPHGFRSPWVTAIAHSMGETTVGWSLGVWDTDRPGADTIVARTVRGAAPGYILLLHDGDGYDPVGDRLQTAHAVPGVIAGLHDRGFTFATLPI
ncbi:MAG: polysaccharide deacetylase family protein [Gemmatimonadota bacterium]|nr:polysaccharide deacetylase family protein [Gemmatimonadota bacterium]